MTISHIGPTATSFQNPGTSHSWSGRMLSLAVAADGQRLYTGCYAGVWRSDDAGRTWRQMTRPQPAGGEEEVPGALFAPTVFDLVVSPADRNLVLAGGTRGNFVRSRDGIYRSTDGGSSWTLVHGTDPATRDSVSQLVIAPDDPTLMFAPLGSALAISTDSGLTWTRKTLPNVVWHVACAPRDAAGVRRVYAAGSGNLYASLDGGATWRIDGGTASMRSTVGGLAGATADNSGSGATVIVVDPSNPSGIFLAAVGAANGPSYYAKRADGSLIPDGTICNATPDRGCGEGSIWYGDYSGFASASKASWTQLPGPPVYWGTTTPSGNSFLATKSTPRGFLLFFADESHVHVSAGRPTGAASWHRLDGKNASQTKIENDLHNRIFVHPDPHGLCVSPDFDITLKAPSGVSAPYNQNSVLDRHLGGTIWMANDGGVYWSADGGRTWTAASGLETLDPVNIAGLAGVGPNPAIYLGTGDNDDFFTLDGGTTWRDPNTGCGDCDAWFADLAQATRVLQFDPRGAGLRVRTSGSGYPDATSGSQTRNAMPPTQSNASSGVVIRGFRPLIRTLVTEAAPADGDYVFTGTRADGTRVLFRTQKISTITTVADWENTAKAQQIGPALPAGVDVVQVSGGHASPVFYVSDNRTLYKLSADRSQWVTIAPGGPPRQTVGNAFRFFANPFDARVIYVLDDAAVRVSVDGGGSWRVADALTRAVTAGGRLSLNPASALNDLLFVRSDSLTMFALGHAGVSYTYDGVDWHLLLSAIAQPGTPEFAFFDGISNPNERALYITLTGRGVQKISPILTRPQGQARNYSLVEIAAAIADA